MKAARVIIGLAAACIGATPAWAQPSAPAGPTEADPWNGMLLVGVAGDAEGDVLGEAELGGRTGRAYLYVDARTVITDDAALQLGFGADGLFGRQRHGFAGISFLLTPRMESEKAFFGMYGRVGGELPIRERLAMRMWADLGIGTGCASECGPYWLPTPIIEVHVALAYRR